MEKAKLSGRKPKNIKNHNLRYILAILREHAMCTASDISKESNLSVTTIVKILDRLRTVGIVTSLGKGPSTKEGGKKPELMAFNAQYKYVACVYFGYDHLVCAITDLYAKVLVRHEYVYEDLQNMKSCLDEGCAELNKVLESQGVAPSDICGISLSIDGIVNTWQNMVVYPIHNAEWDSGTQIVDTFRAHFPEVELIRIENSGRLAAQNFIKNYPEMVNERIVAMYTSQTSTAGVLLDKGECVYGENCLIGEFGHMIVPNARGTVKCRCGRVNCFEKMVALSRLQEYVLEMIDPEQEKELNEKLQRTCMDPKELLFMADSGSRACQNALALIIDYYMSIVCNLMITCDPKYYVIGGVYVRNSRYFREEILARFEQTLFWGQSFRSRIIFDTGYDHLTGLEMARPIVNLFLQSICFDEE